MCAGHGDDVDEDDNRDEQLKGCGIDGIEDQTPPGVLGWNIVPDRPSDPEMSLSDDPLLLLL